MNVTLTQTESSALRAIVKRFRDENGQLKREQEELIKRAEELRAKIFSNTSFILAVEGQLNGSTEPVAPPVQEAPSVKPLSARILSACETFGDRDFNSREVFNQMQSSHLLLKEETMEIVGNGLWKLGRDGDRISCVVQGAGKRPAQYRNATTLPNP